MDVNGLGLLPVHLWCSDHNTVKMSWIWTPLLLKHSLNASAASNTDPPFWFRVCSARIDRRAWSPFTVIGLSVVTHTEPYLALGKGHTWRSSPIARIAKYVDLVDELLWLSTYSPRVLLKWAMTVATEEVELVVFMILFQSENWFVLETFLFLFMFTICDWK